MYTCGKMGHRGPYIRQCLKDASNNFVSKTPVLMDIYRYKMNIYLCDAPRGGILSFYFRAASALGHGMPIVDSTTITFDNLNVDELLKTQRYHLDPSNHAWCTS
jgi:hypothetical protein